MAIFGSIVVVHKRQRDRCLVVNKLAKDLLVKSKETVISHQMHGYIEAIIVLIIALSHIIDSRNINTVCSDSGFE